MTAGATPSPSPDGTTSSALPDRTHVLVVGAGQAGLAAGYHLTQAGLSFEIVDAASRIGQSWRERWDSLRLFTPTSVSALPGLAPDTGATHPSKDEIADYLERYAAHFALPVRLSAPVTALTPRSERGFIATVAGRPVEARHVVVAAGAHRRVRVPGFADDLDPTIVQIDSTSYRRPTQLPAGTVLVVGAGNSGAEIATDIATGAGPAVGSRTRVLLAGRDVGRIPQLGAPVFRVMRHLRTRAGPGRLISRAAHSAGGDPLGRVDPRTFSSRGITRVGRIEAVVSGWPATAEGHVLSDVAAVVWCTGLDPDRSWLRPADTEADGLHHLGLPYQRTLASHLIAGVDRDARALVKSLRQAPSLT